MEGFCYPDVRQCIYVDGPGAATVNLLGEFKAASPLPSYSLRISWKVHDPKSRSHCQCLDMPLTYIRLLDECICWDAALVPKNTAESLCICMKWSSQAGPGLCPKLVARD